VGQTVEIAVNHALVKDLGYEPEKDLQPVALLAVIPVALVVQSSAPYASVGDLLKGIAVVESRVIVCVGGVGTTGHLAGELLRLRTSSRFVHAPFEGAAAASNALLEGRVDFYFEPFRWRYRKSRRASSRCWRRPPPSARWPRPTCRRWPSKRGFAISTLRRGWGIFAPRSTPPEIVTKLNQAINEVLAQPEVRERLISAGAEIAPMSVAQFGDFVRSEIRKNTDLLSEDFCSRVLYGGCEGFGTLQ
jgi:tripartite-type tricarboxylate transporter receptor subunit TctC